MFSGMSRIGLTQPPMVQTPFAFNTPFRSPCTMVQTRSSQFAVKKIKSVTCLHSGSDVSLQDSGSRPGQPWQLNFDVLLIVRRFPLFS